jgi:Ni/Fe-hydrogenase subunit HybB-like protein
MNNTLTNKTRTLKDTLWIFVFFGLIAAIFRIWFGLGATTDLTDAVPWGLWKVFNMIAGVALSTCGFTLGFLVYVLKIEKFKPLIKPAILIAFLGYGSSCLALLFDIGLPDRFWHPFFLWNEHSFLFEVFWCVILYFTVTFIEFVPNILERFKAQKIVNIIHKIAVGVVIIGISLSSLHHSSLGSLFLVTPQRLHQLWYSPLLPWFFFISAAGCGIMFLIFIKILYAKWYDPKSVFGEVSGDDKPVVCLLNGTSDCRPPRIYGKDIQMLSKLSIIATSILGVYLVLKIYDLIVYKSLEVFLSGSWESWLYSIELLLTAIVPIVLITIKKFRNSPYGLASAGFCASFGLVFNRMNVGIFGYFRDAGTIYFPTLAEWALSIGIIAAAALVFLLIVENFPIFDERWKEYKISTGIFKATFDSISRVWQTALFSGLHRITLIGVFVLPIAFVLMYPPYSENTETNISSAKGLDITRSILIIDGNHDGMYTEFPHLEHQNRLGKEGSCIKCHHLSLPKDQSTPCSNCHRHMIKQTKIFEHTAHTIWVAKNEQISGLHPQNHTCTICHISPTAKTSKNSKTCIECHNKDMNTAHNANLSANFIYANGFMDAMHKTCITCHNDQKTAVNKPNLNDCSNCHKSLSAEKKSKRMTTNTKEPKKEIVATFN